GELLLHVAQHVVLRFELELMNSQILERALRSTTVLTTGFEPASSGPFLLELGDELRFGELGVVHHHWRAYDIATYSQGQRPGPTSPVLRPSVDPLSKEKCAPEEGHHEAATFSRVAPKRLAERSPRRSRKEPCRPR